LPAESGFSGDVQQNRSLATLEMTIKPTFSAPCKALEHDAHEDRLRSSEAKESLEASSRDGVKFPVGLTLLPPPPGAEPDGSPGGI